MWIICTKRLTVLLPEIFKFLRALCTLDDTFMKVNSPVEELPILRVRYIC